MGFTETPRAPRKVRPVVLENLSLRDSVSPLTEHFCGAQQVPDDLVLDTTNDNDCKDPGNMQKGMPSPRTTSLTPTKEHADRIESCYHRNDLEDSSAISSNTGSLALPKRLLVHVLSFLPSLELWRDVRMVSREFSEMVLLALENKHRTDAWRVFLTSEREDVSRLTLEIFSQAHRPYIEMQWRGFYKSRGAFKFAIVNDEHEVESNPFDAKSKGINSGCKFNAENHKLWSLPFPGPKMEGRAAFSGNIVMSWQAWRNSSNKATKAADISEAKKNNLLHPFHNIALPISLEADVSRALSINEKSSVRGRFQVGQGCIIGWQSLIVTDAVNGETCAHRLQPRFERSSRPEKNRFATEMLTPIDSDVEEEDVSKHRLQVKSVPCSDVAENERDVEFVRLTRSMKRSIAKNYIMTPPKSVKKQRYVLAAANTANFTKNIFDASLQESNATLDDTFAAHLHSSSNKLNLNNTNKAGEPSIVQHSAWVHPHVIFIHPFLLFARTEYEPQQPYICPRDMKPGSIPLLQTDRTRVADTSGWFGRVARPQEHFSDVTIAPIGSIPAKLTHFSRNEKILFQPHDVVNRHSSEPNYSHAESDVDWVLGPAWVKLLTTLEEYNRKNMDKIPHSFIEPTNADVMRFLVNGDISKCEKFLENTIIPTYRRSTAAWWGARTGRMLSIRKQEDRKANAHNAAQEERFNLFRRREPIRWFGV